IIQTLINKEDTVVEIKYDLNVYSLTYQTNGGSYVPRQTGKYMSEITIASGSTLAGYTFEGWYTNPEFEGDSVSGNLVMTDNVTLYAKWSASSVSYNIVYLVENANDDGYSLLSTGQGTARTGSSVTVTSQQAKPSWGSLPSKAFKFERATNEIVKADGSSVVTVYYSRNEYTITIKGSRNTTYGTIKAKYGSNIADEWLSITKSHTENGTYAWEDNKGNPKLAVLDIMPSEDRTYSRTRNTSYKEETIHYYLEGYAKGNQRNFDGKTFGEYTSVDVRYNYFTKSEEFFDIDGYNQYQATNSKGNKVDFGSSSNISSGDYYFYYTRAEYTLSLINVNDRIDYKVPYTEDISDKLVEPKNKPTNDSVFEGWYIDQGLTEKFTETTMPKGLVLYAKWSAPSYDVKFVSDGVVVETRPVISGKTVDMINAPENPGYDFDGWFVDEECTQLYDFAEPVKESKVLYAGWSKRQMADYVVKYVTETGEQVAESKYGSGKVETTIVEKAVKPEGKFAEYTVDAPSKSIVLSTNSNENVITFTYYATAELTYDVIYTYEGKIIYSVLDNISDVNRIKVYPVLASEIEALQGYSINESFKWADLYYGQDNIIEFTLNVSNFEIDYKNVEDVTWKNGDLVNPNPVSYSIKDISDGKVITLVNPEKRGYAFTGWTLTKGTNPDATHDPMNTVISEGSYGNLEFTANFVIDESQTKELNYTVKHVIGEEVQETLTETQKVQVLQPDTLTRNTELEADRGYKGYKKSTVTYENGEAVEGETIANGAVIVVNYIVDAEQTT
ncbi:InlB B-repeat-containing protein, partial [Holdemania filiformis]